MSLVNGDAGVFELPVHVCIFFIKRRQFSWDTMSQRSANITAQKETFIQKYKKRNQGARVFGLVQMHVCAYIVCVKKEASVVRPPPSRRQWSECSKETLERAQRRCECPCELPNEPGSLKQAALNAFRLHTVGFASAGCHLLQQKHPLYSFAFATGQKMCCLPGAEGLCVTWTVPDCLQWMQSQIRDYRESANYISKAIIAKNVRLELKIQYFL